MTPPPRHPTACACCSNDLREEDLPGPAPQLLQLQAASGWPQPEGNGGFGALCGFGGSAQQLVQQPAGPASGAQQQRLAGPSFWPPTGSQLADSSAGGGAVGAVGPGDQQQQAAAAALPSNLGGGGPPLMCRGLPLGILWAPGT